MTILPGELKIDRREVTLTAEDASKVYDATPLTEGNVKAYKDQLATTDSHNFTVVMTDESTITDYGTKANVIKTVDGTAVSANEATAVGNYLVTILPGELKIDRREVTLTAEDASKVFDATPLTEGGIKAYRDQLATTDDHTFTVVMTEDSTITDYGTQPNVIATVDEVEVSTGVETEVGNYLVTTVDGELEITRKPVTITAKGASKMYDGIALTEGGVEDYSEQLDENDDHVFAITMTNASTIKNFGTQANVIGTVDGVAVTTGNATEVGNYLVTTVDGELSISKRPVTLTSGSDSKTYDGTPLTKPEATVSGEGFVAGEVREDSVVATGTVTNVAEGEVDNIVTFIPRDGYLEDNYDITRNEGKLRIDPMTVTITADSDSREYNGAELKVGTAKNSALATTDAHLFTVTMTDESKITKAGSTDNIIGTVDGTAVTPGVETAIGNYLVTTANGTLEIRQNTDKITVVPGSYSKTYDGTELTRKEHDHFTVTGLPAGFTWTADADGTVTNVTPKDGEKAENAVTSFRIFKDNEDVTDQFINVDKTATGTLTINPAGIAVTDPVDTEYNGEKQEQPVTVTGVGDATLVKDVDYTISYTEATNAGTVTITITGIGNYTGTITKTYEITKRPATVTVPNSWKYLGESDEGKLNKAFTGNGIGNELPATWDVRRTNTDEEVNTYNGVLTLKDYQGTTAQIKAALEAKYTNYTFTVTPGNFEIKAPETSELKITYHYSDGAKDDAVEGGKYAEGAFANHPKKIPDGYNASIRLVSGTWTPTNVKADNDDARMTTIAGYMGAGVVEYEVTYSPQPHKLTIRFQLYGKDDELTTIERTYYGGELYDILKTDDDIPWDEFPAGYHIVEVKGKVMPNSDYEITVFVTDDDTVTFLDDPTPLGINNATLGTGEIIE